MKTSISARIRRATLSVAFLCAIFSAQAQFDTQFWMPPIWETGNSQQNQPSELFISTSSSNTVDVHIQTSDGTTLVIDTTVTSGSPLNIPLTPTLGMTQISNQVLENGFLITSSAAIQVSHRVSGIHNQTVVTLKGRSGLGTEFWTGSQVRNQNATYGPNEHHFISVMATKNNTQITIETPFDMYQPGAGDLPNPFTLTLDAGESYLVRGHGPTEHVAGGHVTSDKEIIVNSGSTHTRIAGGGAADGGTDQLVPIDLVGSEYIMIKGKNDNPFDYVIVVATEDDTEVRRNGIPAPIGTLDQGEFLSYTLNGNFGNPLYIHADKKVYTYHVTGASDDDEVGMSLMPQLNCTGSRYVEFSLFEQNADYQAMNVIASVDALPTLTLNGTLYSDYQDAIIQNVQGNADYAAVTFPQSTLQPDNIISSDGFFHVGFLTGNNGATGTYGFLSGFDDAFEFLDPVEHLPSTIYTVDTLCLGEIIYHCIEVFSCGNDHNIVDFSDSHGDVTIAPSQEPYDTCLSYTAPFNFTGKDSVTFTVTNRFDFEDQIEMVFHIVDPDTPINAGTDQEFCGENNAYLSAVDPDPLVDGYWTVVEGNGTIVDPLDPNSEVTGLSVGENTFQWNQDYGCALNTDQVTVSIFDGTLPAANAGGDEELCSDQATLQLQGSQLSEGAVGTWSVTSGNASIDDINDPNAQASNLQVGTTILTWTVENGPCLGGSTSDEIQIVVYDQNQPAADAGEDQEFCEANFVLFEMEGNAAIAPATGQWTVLEGTGTFDNTSDPNAEVSGLSLGVNRFEWTIDNGPCGTTSDAVEFFIYDSSVPAADAGSDDSMCSDDQIYNLQGSGTGATANGTWTVISGSGVFSDAANPQTVVSNLQLGENIFEWTVENGACGDTSSDQVIITVYSSSAATDDAGEDQEYCETGFTSTTLSANSPISPATGNWNVVSGTGTFADSSDPNTTVSGLSVGSNIFEWTVDNGPCAAPTSDSVELILFEGAQDPAQAGPDVEFCTPTSTYSMQATAANAPAVGTWTLESGTGTINDINDPNANISGLGIGENIFRWTVQNGPCGGSNFDEITITIFDENAPVAEAGPDQEHCYNLAVSVTADMDASPVPGPGNGTWTVIQGGGNFSDSNDPNATVTNLPVGENIYEWAVDNGACSGASSDQVIVLVYDISQPAADAGDLIEICSTQSATTLNANSPVYPASGEWELVDGSGTFADPTDPGTTVSDLSIGVNTFQWTIENGPCDPPATSDQVSVIVYDENAPNADAGPDQSICSGVASVTMDASNSIFPGVGTWTLVSGQGDISDPNSSFPEITNLAVGENIFEWTIDNGPCPSGITVDQVSIFVFDENAPAATAGPDQDLCLPTDFTTLAGNEPIFPATGEWELIAGSGTITDPTQFNTTVTALGVGENRFRWNTSNSPCNPGTTSEEVSIFVFDNTATTADAGIDQEFCEPISSTTLNSNAAVFPATGQWTVVSGSGVIDDPTNPNTEVTGLTVGENIFEWTIDSGVCAGEDSDQVSVFIFPTDQQEAIAGPDQEFCSTVSSAGLSANSATFPAIGTWTLVSGTGTFADANYPNTTVSGLTVGVNTFAWTISNGPCTPATTTDEITILIFDDNAADADAGADQEFCSSTTSTVLQGNSVPAPGQGTWTVISGSGSFSDVNDPNATVSGLEVGDNMFEWTIENGGCAGGTTSDQVTISLFFEDAAAANAGADQNLCLPENSSFLEANSPVYPAVGQWTLVSGTGSFADASDPTTEVTGLSVGANIFEWTITNGPCAGGSTSDQVTITVYNSGGSQADAGPTQELCLPTTSTTLDASAAQAPGEGTWTVFQGTGTFADINDPQSGVTGLSVGTNRLVWTLDYSTCGTQQDTVDVIVFDNTVADAEAGPDQEFCSTTSSTTLNATPVAAPAQGTWTLIAGSAGVSDPNDPATTVSNLGQGENIFVWTIDNGPCANPAVVSDTVSVFIYNSNQPAANAGEDQEICSTTSSVTLDGSDYSAPGIGTWTVISGSGVFSDENDPLSTVSGLSVGENIFEWTVVNGACPSGTTSDQVSIFVFDENHAVANAGADQELCTPVGSISLNGNSLTAPATGQWLLLSGSATILDSSDPNTTVSGLGVGENVFRWTIDNGPCGASTNDIVSITVYSSAAAGADAGADIEICSTTNQVTLAGNSPVGAAEGSWTVAQGTGTFSNNSSATPTVTGLSIGENIFVWTIDNGVCANAITSDSVSVFVFDNNAPLANAGADQEFCSPTSTAFLNADPATFPATGTWQLVNGTGTITDPNDPNSEVTGLTVGANIFEWTVENGPCSNSESSDLVTIFIFDQSQADANAGPDQQLCTPNVNTGLSANGFTSPAFGHWTLIQGTADIEEPFNPTTDVNDLGIGNNVFVWTIDNGACGGITTDTVTVSVFEQNATAANAGPDQEFCGAQPSTNLIGNATQGAQTGEWTLFAGSGTIQSPESNVTAVTNLTVGENIFVWSIDNGSCGISTDTVSVILFNNANPPADAGDDQFFCTPVSTTQMTATTPLNPAEGTWTLISGNGTINDIHNPQTNISGLTIGENEFVWEVYNGPCGSLTTDTLSIFIYDENAPAADAGDDLELCFPQTSATLDGNEYYPPATGQWTLASGTAIIAQPSNPNSIVSGLSVGTTAFVWTIDNGPCTDAITSDTVYVSVFEDGAIAQAGADQFICTPVSTTQLEANTPSSPNVGTWSVISGNGIFDNPNDPNSEVSGLTVGVNVLEWVVDNGACAAGAVADTVQIFVNDNTMDDAFAGNDQQLCMPDDFTQLEADTLIFPATGSWSVISGTGNFDNSSSPTSQVSGLNIGINEFVWTTENGACNNISSDTVIVSLFDENIPQADAGEDIELCTPTSTVQLNATPPPSPAVGIWTVMSGSASISDVNDPNATVSSLTVGTHSLRWTVDNGACAQGGSFDMVNITVFDQNGGVAEAGPDQELCGPIDNTTLEGVAPTAPATGTWTLLEGTGSLSDVNDPSAELSGMGMGEYLLTWTVYNGNCEVAGMDSVRITVFDPSSPMASAGVDQEFCSPFNGTTLEGNQPIGPGYGEWTVISGNASLADSSVHNTTVDQMDFGQTILTWQIYNGPCATGISTDTINLFLNNTDVANANAGEDLSYCSAVDSLQLGGSVTIGNTAFGEWTILDGSGDFANTANEVSYVYDLPVGEHIYEWTVNNGFCGVTSDTMSVFVYDETVGDAYAGEDQEICEDEFYPFELMGEDPPHPGSTTWEVIEGPAQIQDPSNPMTTVNSLGSINQPLEVITSTLTFTIDNGVCGTSTDTVTFTLEDCLTLEVPDAFSPNGDAYNERFIIPNLDKYPGNSLKIFNRWGAQVYSAAPYQNNWRGVSEHSATIGQELPVSTYYYILDLGVDHIKPITGFIYLRR
jgi:gliding motility-associated-like protein